MMINIPVLLLIYVTINYRFHLTIILNIPQKK
jgi:hypothetical protein